MPTRGSITTDASVEQTRPLCNISCQITDEVLGIGSYSSVRLAKNNATNELVAAKILNGERHKREFDQEVQALHSLQHKNIVRLVGAFCDANSRECTLYLEYLPFPTLLDLIQRNGCFPEDDALFVMAELTEAIAFMHQRSIAHMDIKPDNVAFDEASKRLIVFDFGLSMHVDHANPSSSVFVGSPMYMSPQILMRELYNPFCAEVWSLGVTFYEILIGSSPFVSCTSIDELCEIMYFEDCIPIPPHIPSYLKHILDKMLVWEPPNRIKIDQLFRLLVELSP